MAFNSRSSQDLLSRISGDSAPNVTVISSLAILKGRSEAKLVQLSVAEVISLGRCTRVRALSMANLFMVIKTNARYEATRWLFGRKELTAIIRGSSRIIALDCGSVSDCLHSFTLVLFPFFFKRFLFTTRPKVSIATVHLSVSVLINHIEADF